MPKKTLSRKMAACALRLRAAIEGLEPRTLMSTTWVVNSLADNGSAGTLRNAVNSAADGDVITFDPAVFAGSKILQLSQGQLEISHSISIQGPGADRLTLDAEDTSRLFKIDGTANASISGLTILRGDSTASDSVGGGISNDGTLTLSNCWVTGCHAFRFGGGLSNQGTATLIDDTFSQDTAGTGDFTAGGGAIANSGSSITIEESTITQSSVNGTGKTNSIGAIVNTAGVMTVSGSTITNNFGGFNEYGGQSVTLNNNIIVQNYGDIQTTGLQVGNYTGSNNVIGSDQTGDMTAANGNILIGYQVSAGLGTLGYYGGHTPLFPLLAGSPAIDAGNNLLIPSGITTDQRGYSRISNATVDIGSYEYGGVPVTNPPPLVVNSIADGGDYVPGTLTLRQAVSIADYQTTPQTITFDPGVFNPSSLHTITLDGQQLEFSNTAAAVTIAGPGQNVLAIDAAQKSRVFLIDANVSAQINGLAILNGTAATSGGAIDAEGSLTLNNSSIANSTSADNGGGIYSAFGQLTLSGDTLRGNSATAGGGLYSTTASTVVINNSTISNNLAPGGTGGGINAQGSFTMNNSTVSGNSVDKTGSTVQAGGGLLIGGQLVTINASTISGNLADGGLGGGVYSVSTNGLFTINNSTIYGNSASGTTGLGGGIYNGRYSYLQVDDSTIASNTAGNGGGFYLFGGDTTLYNSIVAQNTASASGGANDIYNALDDDYPNSTPMSPVIGSSLSSNNLIDDASSAGGLSDATSGNIIGHPALLGPLANNGGPTLTAAPQAGSPAIDAGSNALANDYSVYPPVALTTDQRGGQRISGAAVDIGAVEIQPLAAPTSLVATAGADEVDLSWAPAPGAGSYEIFRGITAGGESTTPIATVTSPGYLDAAVTAGTQYFYTVEAVSGATMSAASNEASATPVLPVINANPAGDTITLTLDPDGLHVDWTDLASNGKVLIADPVGLTINGQGGNDTITLGGVGVAIPRLLKLNGGAGSFTLNGLPSVGDPLAGRAIDLGDSTLYVSYTSTSSEPLIQQYLKNGLGSATTDVIRSSAATADYGIGYADSAEFNSPNTHAQTVELKYTVYGDVNLDGTVNLADFLALSRSFGFTGSTWLTGDMNYDGATNLSDLLILVRHFGKSVPTPPPAAAALSFASNPTSGPLAARRR